MGKEWYWSRSSRKINGGAKKEKHHHQVVGCMSGIFHLFDLHQLLFTTRNVVADPVPSTSLSSSKFPENPLWKEEILKGVEAPRNSLELDITATATTTTPPSASAFGTDDYEIPFGIQVVLKRKGNSLGEQMGEERSIQGKSTARSSTANVVAKLMGLDALPNHQGFPSFSPRSYCYREEAVSLSTPLIGSQKQQCQSKKEKNQQQKKMDCSSRTGSQTPPPRHPLQPSNSNAMVEEDARRGTRSLPETPRMSFARRSWDSDPRLSVQSNCSTGNHYNNNKENVNVVNSMSASEMQELKCIFEDHSKSKAKSSTRDENGQRSSPSLYANESVRQMKDTVGRIIERGRTTAKTSETTTTTTTKTTTTTTTTNKTPTPTASSSSSPRLVETVERENGPVVVKYLSPPKQGLSSTTKLTKNTKPKQKTPSRSPPPAKCKKVSCDRFNERLKKSPSVATATTSNAISVSSVLAQRKSKRTNKSPPTLPPPPPQIDIQAANLSSLQKQRESGGKNKLPPVPEGLQYVKRVLDKAGIGGHTSLPFEVRWNSSSHPLDPIIFHRLELTNTVHDGPLRHRCNRKLLFDLVDEILGDLLYPYLSDNPRRKRTAATTKIFGESLLHQLWSRIQSFPAADCQVMQDIDALVESDIPASNIRQLLRHPAVEEEADMIACEVERWLVDTLLVENAAITATRPR